MHVPKRKFTLKCLLNLTRNDNDSVSDVGSQRIIQMNLLSLERIKTITPVTSLLEGHVTLNDQCSNAIDNRERKVFVPVRKQWWSRFKTHLLHILQ